MKLLNLLSNMRQEKQENNMQALLTLTRKNLKKGVFSALKTLMLTAAFLFVAMPSQVDAYTTKLDIVATDVNSQQKKSFTTQDPFVSIRLISYYCVETALTGGTYTFTLKITDPSGKVVKQITTAPKAVLSKSVKIDQSFANIPLSFLTKLGSYRIYASFDEKYTEKSLNLTNTSFFEITDGGFSNTLFSQNIALIAPSDEAVVSLDRPYFQWSYNANVAQYSIYVSEVDSPANTSVWKKEGISTNFIQYPSDANKLKAGRRYYWVIKGLDNLGRPIGNNYGTSEVYSFIIGNGDGSNIVLLGPVEQQKVQTDYFQFEWEGLYGEHNYELTLANDKDMENIIWTGSTSETKIVYPGSAAELQSGQKYFWRVKVIVSGFYNLAQSPVGEFLFKRAQSEVVEPLKLPEGKSGLVGFVKGQYGTPVALAYISVEGPLGSEVQAMTYNIASDVQGRYAFELAPGKYKVKTFKQNFKEEVFTVVIEAGKSRAKDITLFNIGTVLTGKVINSVTGEVIPSASVTLKNFYFEKKISATQSGNFSFNNLLPGDFTVEVEYPPFFETKSESVKLVRGTNEVTVYLEGKTTGVLTGVINKSHDGKTMNKVVVGEVKIKALELDTATANIETGVSQAETQLVAGRYEQIDLKPGLYEVTATNPLFAALKKTVQIKAGSVSTLDFVFSSKKIEVTGKVIDEDGSPVKNAQVAAKDKPGMGSCSTDLLGNFKCFLYGGTYELAVSTMTYEPFSQEVTIDGSTNVGSLVLSKQKKEILLTVKDSTGKPVKGAKMRLLQSNRPGSWKYNDLTSDINGQFEKFKLPYFSNFEIEVYHPQRIDYEPEQATIWVEMSSDPSALKYEFVMTQTLKLSGQVQSESRTPLSNSSVTIPGTSYAAITDSEGRFTIRFPMLDPKPDYMVVKVTRSGFYPEQRKVNPGSLSVPIVVRLVDEQKKIASFTNTMLNNTMLEVRTGLDDLVRWVTWAVDKILNDLDTTEALYQEYKEAIDVILNEINSSIVAINAEMAKDYLTVGGLKLSIKMQELNDRVTVLVQAMRIKITKMLNDIESFLNIVKATASVTIPEYQFKIEDVKESIKKSPFVDEIQKNVLMTSAITQETKFNTKVKTFYATKSAEITETFNRIKDKINASIDKTEKNVDDSKEIVAKFLDHIKVISESGGSGNNNGNNGNNNNGGSSLPSLVSVGDLFGVGFELDYIRTKGTNGAITLKGNVVLKVTEGSLPASLGLDVLKLPVTIAQLNTPFKTSTLNLLLRFIKTKEFFGPAPSYKQLQDHFVNLSNLEKSVLLDSSVTAASAAAKFLIDNRKDLFKKLMAKITSELGDGISLLGSNAIQIADLGAYKLQLKGATLTSSGSVASTKVNFGEFALIKNAAITKTIALPAKISLTDVAISSEGVDFGNSKGTIENMNISFKLPGLPTSITFGIETKIIALLGQNKLNLEKLKIEGGASSSTIDVSFQLKPFKVLDFKVNSQPITMKSLLQVNKMFGLDFELDHVKTIDANGKLEIKGTAILSVKSGSLPETLGFNGKSLPLTLQIGTPFQTPTLNLLLKYIKTKEYMGNPPTTDQLKALWPTLNPTEKKIFVGTGIVAAGAAAVYIDEHKEELWDRLTSAIANNLYLIPTDSTKKLVEVGPYDLNMSGLFLSGDGSIASTKLNLEKAVLKLNTARYKGGLQLPANIQLDDIGFSADGKLDFDQARVSVNNSNISFKLPGIPGSISMDQQSIIGLDIANLKLQFKDFALANTITSSTVRANVDVNLKPFGVGKVEIDGQTFSSPADVTSMFGVGFELDYVKTQGTAGRIAIKGKLKLQAKPGTVASKLDFNAEIPITLNNLWTPFQTQNLNVLLRYIKTTENNGVAPKNEELMAIWPNLNATEKAVFFGTAVVGAAGAAAYVNANKAQLWDKLLASIAEDLVLVKPNEEKVLVSKVGPYDLVISDVKLNGKKAQGSGIDIGALVRGTTVSLGKLGFKKRADYTGSMAIPGFIGISGVKFDDGKMDFSASTAYLEKSSFALTIPGTQYTVGMDGQSRIELNIQDLELNLVDIALGGANTTTPLRAQLKLAINPKLKVLNFQIGSEPITLATLASVHKMFGLKFELDYLKKGTSAGKIDLKGTVTVTAKDGTLPQSLGFDSKEFPIQLNNIPTPFQDETLAVILRLIKTKENTPVAPSTAELKALWGKMNGVEKAILVGTSVAGATAAATYLVNNVDSLWGRMLAAINSGIVIVKADETKKLVDIGPYELIMSDVKVSNSGEISDSVDIGSLVENTKVGIGSIGLKLKSNYSGSVNLPGYVELSDVSFEDGKLNFDDAKAKLNQTNFSINIPGLDGTIGMNSNSEISVTMSDLKLNLDDLVLIGANGEEVDVDIKIGLKPYSMKVFVDGDELGSLASVTKMFGIDFELNSLKTVGTEGKIAIDGVLKLQAKKGTLASTLDFSKDFAVKLNSVPTPFSKKTLDVLFQYIKTKENNGVAPKEGDDSPIKQIWSSLTNIEKTVFIGVGVATATGAAAAVVSQKDKIWEKLLAVIAKDIVIAKAGEFKKLASVGPYDLIGEDIKLSNNGTPAPENINIGQLVQSTKLVVGNLGLKLKTDYKDKAKFKLPKFVNIQGVVFDGGKLDFSNASALVADANFALTIPGVPQSIGMDAQSTISVDLNKIELVLDKLAFTNTNTGNVIRGGASFTLKPFGLLDWNIGGQTLKSLADVRDMFGVKFDIDYIKTTGTTGKVALKGKITLEAKEGSIADTLQFSPEIPINLSSIPTPFSTPTLNVLLRFIKTNDYQGAAPTTDELKALWPNLTNAEKAVFIGIGATTAAAGAAYVISEKDNLWQKLLAVIANEIVIVGDTEKALVKLGPYDLVAKNIKLGNNGTPQPNNINIGALISSTQVSIGALGFRKRADAQTSFNIPGYVGIENVTFDGSGKLDFSSATAMINNANLTFGFPQANVAMDANSELLLNFADLTLDVKKFVANINGNQVQVDAKVNLKPLGLPEFTMGGVDIKNIKLSDVTNMFGVEFDLKYLRPSASGNKIDFKGDITIKAKEGTLAASLPFADGFTKTVTLSNIPSPFSRKATELFLRFIKTEDNVAGAPTEDEMKAAWKDFTTADKIILGGAATATAVAGVAYLVANKDSLWNKLMAIIASGIDLVPANEPMKLVKIGPYDLEVAGIRIENNGATDINSIDFASLISSTKLKIGAMGFRKRAGYSGLISIPGYIGVEDVTFDGSGKLDFSKAIAKLTDYEMKFGIPNLAEMGMGLESSVEFNFADMTLEIKKFVAIIGGAEMSAEAKFKIAPNFEVLESTLGGTDLANVTLSDVKDMFGVKFDLEYVKTQGTEGRIGIQGTIHLAPKEGTLAAALPWKGIEKTVSLNNLKTPFQTNTLNVLLKYIKTAENVAGGPTQKELLELWPTLTPVEKTVFIGAGVASAAAAAKYVMDNKDKLWKTLLAVIANGLELVSADQDMKLFDIGPYELVVRGVLLTGNGNPQPQNIDIAGIIQSSRVEMGQMALKLKSGANQKLPHEISINNVIFDGAGYLDFTQATAVAKGTALELDLAKFGLSGTVALDDQSSIQFSFGSLILDVNGIKYTSAATGNSNILDIKVRLKEFEILDFKIDNVSLMGGLGSVAKMFGVKFELDYVKAGSVAKSISFKGKLTLGPKPGSIFANAGMKGISINIGKDDFPFVLQNSTTALLTKFIQTKEYMGKPPTQAEITALWPTLTTGEKAIFTGLGVAAGAGLAVYVSQNKDKLFEMLLAFFEEDIPLVAAGEEKVLFSKKLGPYNIVGKNIVLKKDPNASPTNLVSLLQSMTLSVGELGFRKSSEDFLGVKGLPVYIGVTNVALSGTGELDFSQSQAVINATELNVGMKVFGQYIGLRTDENTKMDYTFSNSRLKLENFMVTLPALGEQRLGLEIGLNPVYLFDLNITEGVTGGANNGGGSDNMCSTAGTDPATGETIINANNPEQLALALKMADIQTDANAIKNTLAQGVNGANEVPNALAPFYKIVNTISYNLKKAQEVIKGIDAMIQGLLDVFDTTKEFAGTFEKNFHIDDIKGFSADLNISRVQGNEVKFNLSGSIKIPATGKLPSFSIPIPKSANINIDISKVMGSNAMGSFMSAIRKGTSKLKDFLVGKLGGLNDLITNGGKSALNNLIPAALLNFNGSFLSEDIADTEQYTDQIPSSVTNFNADEILPAWLMNFDFCSLSDEEKEKIKTMDSYAYVYSNLSTYHQSLLPAEKITLKNLSPDFLVKTFFPNGIKDILKAVKEGAANIVKDLVLEHMPPSLLPMAELTFDMLQNGLDNTGMSDFVKAFLPQKIREALPIDLIDMVLGDITPDDLKGFDPAAFLANLKDNVKQFITPKLDLKKNGQPLEFQFGDLEKHPFGVKLTDMALGVDPSTDLAFLKADMIVTFGDKIRGTIKGLPETATLDNIKIFQDGSANLSELRVNNINVDILGFKVQVQKFLYNFDQEKIGMEARFDFKLLGESRKLKVNDLEIKKNDTGKWKLSKLNFNLSPPIRISSLELSGLNFDAENEILDFAGALVGNDSRLRRLDLSTVKFQDGKLIEASGSFSNLEFTLFSKVKVSIESISVSMKSGYGGEQASFRVKMLNSVIGFGDFKSDAGGKYTISVGKIDVYWRKGEKLDFDFDDLNATLDPFEFKGFSFHIKVFSIKKVRVGGVKKTQMRIQVKVEINISGSDGMVESSWVFVQGQQPLLERLVLDLNISGNRVKGILINKPAFLYAAVEITLSGGLRAWGEFFKQDADNWQIRAGLELPTPITFMSIGFASIAIKGGSFTIGEREGDLIIGFQVNITICLAVPCTTATQVFDGSVGITMFFGENLVRITGSGKITLSSYVEVPGNVYAEFDIKIDGADSYFSGIVTYGMDLFGFIKASCQMNMYVSQKYMSMAFAAGATIKFIGLSLGLSAGFQFAIRFTENAPLSSLMMYNGVLYQLPTDIKAGVAFFVDGFLSISLADFGIPTSILAGSLSAQAGAAAVLDFGKMVFAGGAFAKINGYVQLLNVVSVSIAVGAEMAAQIGKKETYFVGNAYVSAEACVIGICYGPINKTLVVSFGNPPTEMLNAAANPSFEPNQPKGALEIRVRDPFGIPLKNMEVKIQKVPNPKLNPAVAKAILTNLKTKIQAKISVAASKGIKGMAIKLVLNLLLSKIEAGITEAGNATGSTTNPNPILTAMSNDTGSAVTPRTEIYELYTVKVTDPDGRYAMAEFCEPGDDEACQVSDVIVDFSFSGKTYFVKMFPQTPMIDISVNIVKPAAVANETASGYKVPEMRVKVTDMTTTMDATEVSEQTEANALRVGSLETKVAKVSAGMWANVSQLIPEAGTKYKITLTPPAESFYAETVKENVDANTLAKMISNSDNQLLNQSRKIIIPLEIKKIEVLGRVVNLNGDGVKDVNVIIKDKNSTEVGTAITDASGEFKIADLVPGTYTATVSKTNFTSVNKSFELTPSTTEVKINLESQSNVIQIEAKDVTGTAVPNIQFYASGDVDDTCTTDTTGKCELKKLKVGKTYTIRTGESAKGQVISMANSTLAQFDETTKITTFLASTPSSDTIKYVVQTGVKLTGKFVNQNGDAVMVSTEQFKITDANGIEKTDLFKRSKEDGTFEIFFNDSTNALVAKLEVNKSGTNKIIKDITLDSMGQKPNQAIGNIAMNFDSIKFELVGKEIMTPAGFKLVISDDATDIESMTNGGVLPFGGLGEVFKVKGKLVFESNNDFAANGSIAFKEFIIGAKYGADGKSVEIKLVSKSLGGSEANLDSNSIAIKAFGLEGKLREVQVNLDENGTITGKPSIMIQNEIPLFTCDSKMTFDSSERVASIDGTGVVKFDLDVAKEYIFKLASPQICNGQGPKFEMNASDSLKLVNMGNNAAVHYKMKLMGWISMPSIGGQTGFNRLGGSNAQVTVLVDVKSATLEVPDAGQAETIFTTENVVAVDDNGQSINVKITKVKTTANGFEFTFDNISGSLAFDDSGYPSLGPDGEQTSTVTNDTVVVNGKMNIQNNWISTNYGVDYKGKISVKLFYNGVEISTGEVLTANDTDFTYKFVIDATKIPANSGITSKTALIEKLKSNEAQVKVYVTE